VSVTVASPAVNSSKSLHAPVIGFVSQPGPQLRPLLGTAGAVVLGDPIALPDGLTNLVIAPTHTFAIAERGTDQEPVIIPIGLNGAGAPNALSGAFPRSGHLEFSPSGRIAVLYSAKQGRAQLFTELPESPRLSQEFDLSSLPAPVTAIAVSDGGSLLIGVSDGQNGAVYRATQNRLINLLPVNVPSAIRFLSNSDSAVVADSLSSRILLVSSISDGASARLLAGAANGVDAPVLVQIAGDRFVIAANTNSMLSIDLVTSFVTSVPLSSPATKLHPIADGSMAVIESDANSYWLFRSSAKPQISFIPSFRSDGRTE
jgi:hypothetical protein